MGCYSILEGFSQIDSLRWVKIHYLNISCYSQLGSWEQLVKAPFIEKSYDFNTNKILYIILWWKDSVTHLWLNSIFSVFYLLKYLKDINEPNLTSEH